MGSQTHFMKGVLELCVLKIISKEPTYGYAILTELQKSSYSDLPESTLYPLLFRLEQHKDVTIERRPSPNGPSRKYYTITEHGRETLSEYWKSWQQVCELVSTVFQKGAPYEWLSCTPQSQQIALRDGYGNKSKANTGHCALSASNKLGHFWGRGN